MHMLIQLFESLFGNPWDDNDYAMICPKKGCNFEVVCFKVIWISIAIRGPLPTTRFLNFSQHQPATQDCYSDDEEARGLNAEALTHLMW